MVSTLRLTVEHVHGELGLVGTLLLRQEFHQLSICSYMGVLLPMAWDEIEYNHNPILYNFIICKFKHLYIYPTLSSCVWKCVSTHKDII